jgi:hypothetical protein
MSYHFYDMGFKDGYKKALNEQQMVAPQTAMQPTVPPSGGGLPSRANGTKGKGGDGSYNREAPHGMMKLDVDTSLFGISLPDLLNQYLELLGLTIPDGIQRWFDGEIDPDSFEVDDDGNMIVVIDGVEYVVVEREDGSYEVRYTDEDGTRFHINPGGNAVFYTDGTTVFIRPDGTVVVYPSGWKIGTKWYEWNPITEEWTLKYPFNKYLKSGQRYG